MAGDNRAGKYKWAENYGAGLESLEKGNFAKAIRSLEAAVVIAEKLELTEPLSNSLISLGEAYSLNKQFDRAEQAIKKAIEISDQFLEDGRLFVLSNTALGTLYFEMGRTLEAKLILERAVEILKKSCWKGDPDSIVVFVALITCYMQLNDFEAGEKLAEYAADLSNRVLGPKDSATIMIFNMWAVCVEACGNTKKATAIRARINLSALFSIKPQMNLGFVR